jgi:hypothetical protein
MDEIVSEQRAAKKRATIRGISVRSPKTSMALFPGTLVASLPWYSSPPFPPGGPSKSIAFLGLAVEQAGCRGDLRGGRANATVMLILRCMSLDEKSMSATTPSAPLLRGQAATDSFRGNLSEERRLSLGD